MSPEDVDRKIREVIEQLDTLSLSAFSPIPLRGAVLDAKTLLRGLQAMRALPGRDHWGRMQAFHGIIDEEL